MGINLSLLAKCRSRYVDQLRNIIPDDVLNEKENFRLLIDRISACTSQFFSWHTVQLVMQISRKSPFVDCRTVLCRACVLPWKLLQHSLKFPSPCNKATKKSVGKESKSFKFKEIQNARDILTHISSWSNLTLICSKISSSFPVTSCFTSPRSTSVVFCKMIGKKPKKTKQKTTKIGKFER